MARTIKKNKKHYYESAFAPKSDKATERERREIKRMICHADTKSYWVGVQHLRDWHAMSRAEAQARRIRENIEFAKRHRESIKRAAERSLSPLAWARLNADRVRAMLATQKNKEVAE